MATQGTSHGDEVHCRATTRIERMDYNKNSNLLNTHTHTPIQNNILCIGSTQLNVPQVENYIPGRRPLLYVPHPKKTTKK